MDVKHRVNGSMLDSHMGQEVIVVSLVIQLIQLFKNHYKELDIINPLNLAPALLL